MALDTTVRRLIAGACDDMDGELFVCFDLPHSPTGSVGGFPVVSAKPLHIPNVLEVRFEPNLSWISGTLNTMIYLEDCSRCQH